MNITSVGNLNDLSRYGTGSVAVAADNRNASFDSLFQAAVGLVKETNQYTEAAKEAEIAYALGLTNSTTDLLVAQQKANMSMQYTVAIRNGVLEAYREIMNLQF